MSTKEMITKDGKVLEALMSGMFRIELEGIDEDNQVLASLSGRMRKFRIRIMPGDRVKIEFSPHDPKRGRITFRYKG